jgi:hypothetical protein
MTDHRARYGSHNAEQVVDLGESRFRHGWRGHRASAPAHTGSNPVMVGLRGSHVAPRRLAEEVDPAGSLLDTLRTNTEQPFPALIADHR